MRSCRAVPRSSRPSAVRRCFTSDVSADQRPAQARTQHPAPRRGGATPAGPRCSPLVVAEAPPFSESPASRNSVRSSGTFRSYVLAAGAGARPRVVDDTVRRTRPSASAMTRVFNSHHIFWVSRRRCIHFGQWLADFAASPDFQESPPIFTNIRKSNPDHRHAKNKPRIRWWRNCSSAM